MRQEISIKKATREKWGVAEEKDTHWRGREGEIVPYAAGNA